MKILHPVDEATYAKIGKAYLICSEFPEVFGNVTFRKFCSMFVDDILDEEIDEHDARKKAAAPEMYRILKDIVEYCERGGEMDFEIEEKIDAVLDTIDRKAVVS